MKLIAAAVSDTGKVRQQNEDSFLMDETTSLFAVADGMGGHSYGEIASTLAIETIRANFKMNSSDNQLLKSIIQEANKAVFNKANSDNDYRGMGTTITLAHIDESGKLTLGHVGDSRAYVLRGDRFVQVSQDHSVVAALIESGTITPAQAEIHPQKSVITRALGIDPLVQIDLSEVELELNDRILLCSDGLTSMVDESNIQRILDSETNPKDCVNELIKTANEAGGKDNITALIIDVLDLSLDSPKEEDTKPELHKTPKKSLISQKDQEQGSQMEKKANRTGIRFFILTLIALLVVVVGIATLLTYKFNNSYYVDSNAKKEIILNKGIEDSPVFWLNVKEVKNTKIKLNDATQRVQLFVSNKTTFDSLAEANKFLKDLK